MTEVKKIGFSPDDEARFLQRLDNVEISRRSNLEQELRTQLAEDFGMIKFTLRYDLIDGVLMDKLSKQKVVEMTARGGVDEETVSITKIENGLEKGTGKTWIHFSPKNDILNYPDNCVDFWRKTDKNKVVWNRIVVKNGFEEMNRIRSFLSGEKEFDNQNELLRSPIESDLELSELFSLFVLSERENACTLDLIKSVVSEYTDEFNDRFGDDLTGNSEVIFRLYSACYKAIQKGKVNDGLLTRHQLSVYMFGEMNKTVEVESFGCSVSTVIGEFGEKIGFYVGSDGQVKYGEIPENFKECKKCGCWYSGEKCPFCN